ncbi:cytochrome P450 [Mycobacterium sp. HNNTM2301]|uniref:cytochrome P450 n=1 Tax=Mycobacterium hainanense TaxID=3289775 RepID=UPI0035A73F12
MGTASGSQAAQDWAPHGQCPFHGSTSNSARPTYDATAPTDGLANRRVPTRRGYPAAATMRRDAQLARACAPMVAKALAAAAGKARSRRAGNPDPKHVQFTEFDPLNPAIARDPYPHYRKLLAGERVQYNPKRDVYILSRHADVREAARNHDALSSARGVTFSQGSPPFLPTSDPPVHTGMRKQLAPGLTRGALEAWRPTVNHLARELVGGLVAQQTADVVSAVATPMAMRTITNVLGVAGGDEAAFRRLSNRAICITDVNLSGPGLISLVRGFAGFRQLRALFTHRRDNGLLSESTILGQLVEHAEHGRLSDSELSLFAVLLLVAGYETTANMISTLFLTLADFPDQFRLLAQRPDLIPSAIEEQLRFMSPVQNVCRTTRIDYTIGDVVIPAGSLVMLAWAAANRDPRQYDDPDVFRADRNPTGNLAFGSGIHSCPGSQLARMEGQAVLGEIVANIDRIEVLGPPEWTTNANLRGLTRLRIAVTPRQTV